MRPDPDRSFDPPSVIDLKDQRQVDYWADRLQATPDEITEAVENVGPHRTAVAIWLGRGDAV
jgi:hypothetical protein